MIVLLQGGTVGEVDKAEVGSMVTVALRDMNGMIIEAYGLVIEILED